MAASAAAQHWNNVAQDEVQGGVEQSSSVRSNPLQAGRCGFRELSSGNECGCRKFWQGSSTEKSQCACGHHACFHSAVEQGSTSQRIGSHDSNQNLNSSLAAHLAQLSRLLGTINPAINTASVPPIEARNVIQLTEKSSARLSDLLMIDKSDDTQRSASTSCLPRVPSACLLPQAATAQHDDQGLLLKSHASPSESLRLWLRNSAKQSEQAAHIAGPPKDDMKQGLAVMDYEEGLLPNFDFASPTRILSTASRSEIVSANEHRWDERLPAIDVSHYHNIPGAEDLIQSATEMDTPSIGSRTPDFNIPPAIIRANESLSEMGPPLKALTANLRSSQILNNSRALTPTSHAPAPDLAESQPQTLREIATHLSAVKSMLNEHSAQLRGFHDRVDMLERASSFSHASRDQDIIDKIELIETRIVDVESKIEDLRLSSSRNSDKSSFLLAHRDKEIDHDITSQQSLQSLTGDSNGIKVRMNALDERIADLEKCVPPSLSRPLEIEVVLLPWGRGLRGLWTHPGVNMPASRMTTQDSEDWMSLPSSSKSSTFHGVVTGSGWTNNAIHEWADDAEEWLVPKAFSMKSIVYSRLKSRGFVKSVDICKSGAREVQEAIVKAFSSELEQLTSSSQRQLTQADHDCDSPYLGLMAPLIPLRKVHRSSELRFLSKSEMLTSALWNAEFLLSSVIMHAAGGVKRLFMTHTEAYFQRTNSEFTSWTWQRLRALPQVEVDSVDAHEDLLESCWAEHPILDAKPPSANNSFASNSVVSMDRRGVIHDGIMNHVDVKSESHSGSESDALPSAEHAFVPITPVTEHDISFSDQPGMDDREITGYWYGSQSDMDEGPSSTPHPEASQANFSHISGVQQRYNLRQHKRTFSNPLVGRSPIMNSSRSSQQTKPKRVARSFSTPSNPLIAILPSFVPSSPRAIRTRASRRRATDEPGSSGNKRRRVDRSVSVDEVASYHMRSNRQSRSVSASMAPQISTGMGKGKRAMTPIGPYLTPYSGNFDQASEFGDDDGNRDEHGDGEVWEGLEGLENESQADDGDDAGEMDQDSD